MTSKERLTNILLGNPIDRMPIMPFDSFEALRHVELSEGRDLAYSLQISGKLDDYTNGWKLRDERYSELVKISRDRGCDVIHRTTLPELDRRFLLIDPGRISFKEEIMSDRVKQITYSIDIGREKLEYVEEVRRGHSTTWTRKKLCDDIDDALALLDVPWEFKKPDMSGYLSEQNDLGDDGLMCCFISSPIVCVSHLFDFQDFLLFSLTRKDEIHTLIRTVYERIDQVLDSLLEQNVGPVFEFGGSEQATPPMMSPEMYDEYVVSYDGRLIEKITEAGKFVRVHCHGNTRDALPKMIDMGAHMTNPVEAPPSGDVTIKEAISIVQDRMVLEGNIQYADLETAPVDEIIRQVNEFKRDAGSARVILEPSEWPLTWFTDRQFENYRAFINEGTKPAG